MMGCKHTNPTRQRGNTSPTRQRGVLVLAAVVVLIGAASPALAADPADAAAKVAALAPEQKADLLRKKERFDALPEGERERLRELHTSLETTPNSLALSQTMDRYSE